MALTRFSNLDVSLFSVANGSYIDDLKDATFSVDVESADARALKDSYKFPWPTGRGAKIEATVFASAAPSLVALAAVGTAQVGFSFNTGGRQYSGQGLITSASHKVGRDLQEQTITIEIQGAPTVS